MSRLPLERAARGALVAAVLSLTACARGPDGGDGATPAPDGNTPPAAREEAPPPAGASSPGGSGTTDTAVTDTARGPWTIGIVEQRRPGTRMTVLNAVRAARHPGFDRVVFEFAGGEIPGYHLEYVDRPVRQCGSGDPVDIAGDGWLAVRLEPSQAHDDEGRATVQDRRRMLDLPVLRELRAICDFEGQVEWVLGVASPNRYRVLELRDPARLVVDVRH